MADTPAHDQTWYQRNKERVLENVKRWQAANPDKVKIYKNKWYQENEKYRKQYASEHSEEATARAIKWNQDNPERAHINAKKHRDSHLAEQRAKTQRRRAKKALIPHERVVDINIFERDDWVCQLCSKKVDKNLKWPHPLSKSIDHVIPITTEGSSHTEDNLQLAHLACNSRKKNNYVQVI